MTALSPPTNSCSVQQEQGNTHRLRHTHSETKTAKEEEQEEEEEEKAEEDRNRSRRRSRRRIRRRFRVETQRRAQRRGAAVTGPGESGGARWPVISEAERRADYRGGERGSGRAESGLRGSPLRGCQG